MLLQDKRVKRHGGRGQLLKTLPKDKGSGRLGEDASSSIGPFQDKRVRTHGERGQLLKTLPHDKGVRTHGRRCQILNMPFPGQEGQDTWGKRTAPQDDQDDPKYKGSGHMGEELPRGDCFADSTPLGFNTTQIPHFKTPKKNSNSELSA